VSKTKGESGVNCNFWDTVSSAKGCEGPAISDVQTGN